jgi:photosystem II stability/assembly factor-like uncharacterized protein
MKNNATKRLLTIIGAAFIITTAVIFYVTPSGSFNLSPQDQLEKEPSQVLAKQMGRTEMKKARNEYFFNLMRDPATNKIPANIRNRELNFAKSLPTARQVFSRAKATNPALKAADYTWQQAGPFDVGGRTRALAVDSRDPNVVLAGGVSGGMWKSTDGGQSWQLTTPDLPNLSVTSVAQDPQNPDTWYYASGEVLGNSANAVGAAYYGEGIYKSTNNGDSWSLLSQASSNTKGLVDPFNTVSRIRISPTTGTIFIASTGFGIYRSTDGQSFSSNPVLGTEGEQLFTDVAVASDGTVGAVLSEAAFDDQQSQNPTSTNHNPGIFVSQNDGQAWIEVTPDDFPDTYRRSVIAFAPSNPDILYVFTLKGAGNTDNQGVSFFKIDVSDPQNPVAEDRSANLPDFRTDDSGSGYVELQGGYNMVVAVKPDNPNYVIVGGTNLFRSSNGFATKPSEGYDGNDTFQKDKFWIGGYKKDNSFGLYPNHHPDQHIVVFPEPNSNPDAMWSGHDGGLSFTNDVTANSVTWVNRDDGYVTSQFYAADIPESGNDNRLMGGTQDNGSPFFEKGQPNTQTSSDISSGDGGYAYFTDNYLFTSSQQGRTLRWSTDFQELSFVQPSGASNQLFIHPYVVDPNDENVMYYPDNNYLWRNTTMNQIAPGNNGFGTTTGWEELQNVNVGSQHIITALEVSQNPGNILYFGGYNSNSQPVIKRLNNAKTATSGANDISLPSNSDLNGAYIKDIAINPANANEVMVVMSNYNIVGLYHTLDGGQNWTAVEGNLTGTEQNPGPSLRSAAMIPAESGTIYFVGTTTGLYSTQSLEGNNTVWGQEAANSLGNVVTEHLASRISDGDIVAATHGRGLFYGDFGGTTNVQFILAEPFEGKPGDTITLKANDFEFSTQPSDNTVTFRSTAGEGENVNATVLNATPSELQVEIPRGIGQSGAALISVEKGNTVLTTSFELLPPNDFTIEQNYPNPFNPTTTIPFDVPVNSRVTLTIYNINGQKVMQPIKQQQFNSGTYNADVDFTGLASGVYIYRIFVEALSGEDDAMQSKKMTYIK